jgi:hypothetical protein
MAPPLKPPARALGVRALRSHGAHTVLTSQAIDALFRTMKVLTEGEIAGEPERPIWYGSVLITFALAGLGPERDWDRVVEAITGSARVRLLAHRVARGQLEERYPDRDLGTAVVESRFRRAGALLFLDLDLEAPIEVACSRRRAR